MVKTRIIQSAQGAHAYPLLIKSLLLSGGRSHPEREIVYADKLRYDYRTLKQRIHRLANMLTAAGVMPGDHRRPARLGQPSRPRVLLRGAYDWCRATHGERPLLGGPNRLHP